MGCQKWRLSAYKSFSEVFKSFPRNLFLVELVKRYHSRELYSPRKCWNKSLKTSLYSLHLMNFTIWFVLNCSIWKVKHAISVTTSKNQTLDDIIRKWNFQVHFRLDIFQKKTSWNFEALCFTLLISFLDFKNGRRFSVLKTCFDSSVCHLQLQLEWIWIYKLFRTSLNYNCYLE